jgi:hypothetical protein
VGLVALFIQSNFYTTKLQAQAAKARTHCGRFIA